VKSKKKVQPEKRDRWKRFGDTYTYGILTLSRCDGLYNVEQIRESKTWDNIETAKIYVQQHYANLIITVPERKLTHARPTVRITKRKAA
jgi:hypothetical protein